MIGCDRATTIGVLARSGQLSLVAESTKKPPHRPSLPHPRGRVLPPLEVRQLRRGFPARVRCSLSPSLTLPRWPSPRKLFLRSFLPPLLLTYFPYPLWRHSGKCFLGERAGGVGVRESPILIVPTILGNRFLRRNLSAVSQPICLPLLIFTFPF